MYLKKIEIQGFKSFANKTVFEFNNGVTGIVGPNGSGKSNVSDAVRWVLGEQSAKQLRGGNMQDVIFAGTQLRKPQGFAYVALTLDNKDHQIALDFDEVVVSRRLYRSGESEYMLNGSVCRLKDIHELFYDTGIGKDGYSIIGQGQIDKILSSKPEDRRELFDEAVGITKYKRRKILTLKNLESERQNLTRINDILSELESRVGPLSRQAEAAKEYLRLYESLKKNDINLFLRESGSLNEEIKDIEKNTEILNGDLEQANLESENLKVQYEDLVNLIDEYDNTIQETREKIADSNIEIGNLTGNINVLNEQINTEKLNTEHLNARLDVLAKEIETRNETLAEYRKQEAEKNEAYVTSKDSLAEAEKNLINTDERIMMLEQLIEDSNNAMIAGISERAEINANNEKMSGLLEQLQVRKSEFAQKVLKAKSDVATVEAQFEEEKQKLASVEDKLLLIDDKLYALNSDKNDLEKAAEEKVAALDSIHAKYQNANAKLESLKNIAERYEGYNNPVKRVMEQGGSGVHGVVADLISVDAEYETAIETALGGKIQNVVTDDEETAKGLISFLKQEKLGRATFLPLTAMNEKEWDAGSVLNEQGVIGLASKLVKFEAIYEGMVNHLLGKTIVVDNINDAIALQRRHGYEYRLVTKEGEYLAPGGSISGGAYKKDSNLLGRKREIDELTEKLEKINEEIKNAETELQNARIKLADKLGEIEAAKSEKQEALIEKNTANINLEAVTNRLSEFTNNSDDIENELLKVDSEIESLGNTRSRNLEAISALDAKHDELNETLDKSGQELEEKKSSREALANLLSQAQLASAGNEHELNFIRENIARIEDEITTFEAEQAELNANTDTSQSTIDEKLAAISEGEKRIDALREEIVKLDELVKETNEKKESKSTEQRQYFEKRDEISLRITELDKDIFRLQSRKEKCEEKLDSQTNYMWNEYEVTLATAEDYRDDELGELSEMKKTVSSLKSDIKKLGPVNVNAIDEYAEVSERYELMKTQHEDIVKAEAELVKIIEELDEGMKKQFEENFAKIQIQFDKVFKELFGGGQGALELEEEEGVDILEAGVKIIAQPPGKKLQNMMQLSGGEKALTAICLLFAIQNLRPSPFALLDEIEAALDDTNVDRFAHYLNRLTKNTQFIVITHRRGTMVCADRLYGITMQEKGVSTLVSVNLIEAELDD